MIVSAKRLLLAGLLATTFLISSPTFAQTVDVPATLVLDQAIAWALEHSPVLGASASRADAANASRSQAGALPNPEISVEAENIYGDGPYDGVDVAEITYGVSQLVELPGKRGNRIRVAEAEKTKIHYASDGARLDLIRDVTIAYAELVAAQRDLAVIAEERNLAAEVRNSVAARVDAGKEPPIQRNKAEIELSSSDIALERARRSVNTKKKALEILMGGNLGDFTVDAQTLPAPTEPEPFLYYREQLARTPDVKSFEADVTQAQSMLSLEKASAFPDPTVGFGVRQFREDDRQAFVAGVSFPLPVFNINRAGIQRAGHELNAAKLEQRGGELSLEASLTEAYENFVSAYREASTLNDSVLPGAEEAFSFSRQGYDAGKFGYLEVLDAQRTLFDARRQYNEAIFDYYRQRATIERMTAIHAHENTSNKE
ncbi:TolC family protein [Micavibrio aeruginosavorus]|uniref:Outer membrane efflux family protein n=1 Tax=Micavibrio aeruginosavorus (strain ARL-13) TaxID=856793 RepID=G2KS16_MICAA|nr:TolC family protein [Micavibrio aeruginosavorus]AEP10524.1 outer membrane efflux family protein [Micavibrio aeruginosavorus ARL-13]